MLLIFLGIMTGQFLYMCTLWLQHKRKEYAYYIIHYIIFAYFLFGLSYAYLFTAEYIRQHQNWFRLLLFQPLHIFNYYFYIKFAQYFLETRQFYPAKNRQAVTMMRAVWVCTAISVICWSVLGATDQRFQVVYLVISIGLMIGAIWLVYLIYTMHTRQSSFIFRGSFLLSVGVLLTYLLISLAESGVIPKSIGIFYPSVLGVLGEIYFVTAGLNYKASSKRKQLISTQQQLIEELERNKILLHDRENVRNALSLQLNTEIGLTLNGISLFAEYSLNRLQTGIIADVQQILNRIVHDSNKMVSSMSDIVWVLTTENDNLDKTLRRIHQYTAGKCIERGIALDFNNSLERASLKMDMEERKSLYAFYKTVLNSLTDGGPEGLHIHISADTDHEINFRFRESRNSGDKGLGAVELNESEKLRFGFNEERTQHGDYCVSFNFQTHPPG